MKDKRVTIAVLLMAVTLIACITLIAVVVISARSGNQQLTNPQNYGLLLIDIDDSSLRSMHVPREGVYILSVEEGSAADLAGLCSGDRLVSVDGNEIGSSSDFINYCSEAHPEGIKLTLERGDHAEPIELVLQ